MKIINFVVANISEDVKLSIITALIQLHKNANFVILDELYNKDDCKNIGYLIYICIQIINKENMNILRFAFTIFNVAVGTYYIEKVLRGLHIIQLLYNMQLRIITYSFIV